MSISIENEKMKFKVSFFAVQDFLIIKITLTLKRVKDFDSHEEWDKLKDP